MNNRYFDQLPENVADLVKEIEEYSGKEIQVAPNPYPISSTDPNPTGPACMVDEARAQIFIRDGHLDVHAFTHELLHIHRYWVRKIPQILPVRDPDGSIIKITSSIENAIEHLVIVPEEKSFGFEPYSHWNATCRENWERFNPENMVKFAVRKNCLLGWLSASNLVTDPDVISIAEMKIKKQGFIQKAKQMNFKVLKYRNSKERQISCLVKFLQIPLNEVKLVYFDTRNGSRIEKKIDRFNG